MKAIFRRRLFWLCVSAFFFTSFIYADTHNLTFNIEDFDIERHDSVVVITPNTMDYMFEDDVTQPAIPFMIYKKQIEGIYKDGSFEVQIEDMTLLLSNVYIAPNKPSVSNSVVSTTTNVLYTDSIYPISSPMDFRLSSYESNGMSYMLFSVSPFVYDAKNKTLYFISSLRYTYSTEPLMERTSDSANSELDYLIVTSSELKDAFTPLKAWKIKKGVKSEVITVEDIYQNYTEYTTNQEKIKRCLYDYHLNKGIKWVLLGGDVDIVPSQTCYISYLNTTSSVVSDLYYATFEGDFNWDADHDNCYGEAEDGMNLHPNIYLSRLPISNKEQVLAYINKLLRYEKTPHIDGWMDKMLMMGHRIHASESGSPYRSDAHYKGEIIYSNYIEPYASNLSKKYLYDTGNNLDYAGGMTRQI